MSGQEEGDGTSPFREWWQFPRQIFIRCPSEIVPCPEAMGYTMGKTLGSGTYAKVKAAWSPFEGRMVGLGGRRGEGLCIICVCTHFPRPDSN